jgi:hypothetical protein
VNWTRRLVIVLCGIATNRSTWSSVTAEWGRVRTRSSSSASVNYQAIPGTTTLQPSSLERKSSASKATTLRCGGEESGAWCRAEEDRSLGVTEVDRKQSVVGGGLFNILVDFRTPRSVRPGGFPKKPWYPTWPTPGDTTREGIHLGTMAGTASIQHPVTRVEGRWRGAPAPPAGSRRTDRPPLYVMSRRNDLVVDIDVSCCRLRLGVGSGRARPC